MKPLKSVGDAFILIDRPFNLESRLMSSELERRLATTEGGIALLAGWNKWRDMSTEAGIAMQWLGWGTRVGIALRPNETPVIAISPGLLAPLGGRLFTGAGFKESEIEGRRVYEKDGLIMTPVDGVWVLGDMSGISAVYGAKAKPVSATEKDMWKNLKRKIDPGAPLNIIIKPDGIKRGIGMLTDELNLAALEDWTTFSSWEGMVWNVRVSRRGLTVDGCLLAGDTPLPAMMRHTGKSGDFTRWLPPGTIQAGWLGVPRFLNIWRQSIYTYKDRPGPRDVLHRVEMELDRELNIDLDKLVDHVRNDVGFIEFTMEGKGRTVLVAGIGSGTEAFLTQMEKGVSETQWKSIFITREIRYLKRLLAYAVVDDHIVIASNPETLGAYFTEIKKRKEVSRTLLKLAGNASEAPLVLTGTLLDEVPPATGEISTDDGKLWYGLTVGDGGHIRVGLNIPGKMKKTTSPPWKVRFLIWALALVRMALYLIVAVSLVVLVFRSVKIVRYMRNPAKAEG